MIPLVMDGKNVMARARTGSGKTAAFLLPVIQKVIGSAAVKPFHNRYALLLIKTYFRAAKAMVPSR